MQQNTTPYYLLGVVHKLTLQEEGGRWSKKPKILSTYFVNDPLSETGVQLRVASPVFGGLNTLKI